jgi:hypothetical protein
MNAALSTGTPSRESVESGLCLSSERTRHIIGQLMQHIALLF